MKPTLIVATLVFLFDQISKFIVVRWMNLQELGRIEVFPPYLVFQSGWNRGINFGLFANSTEIMRWALIALSIVISLLLLRWARQTNHRLSQILFGFIIGGALANAFDRVIYGAVSDFLNMSCCGINNPYVFNTADIAIFAGAFGLIFFGDKTQNNR